MGKKFDCMEMKRRGAEALRRRLEGMSFEEEVEFWRKRSEQFEHEQQKLRDGTRDSGDRPTTDDKEE